MTDTRLAAMQAAVDAARADMGDWSVATTQALQAALAALDALPAQPAGETVEVRAHVYLDLADGGFVIHEAGYEVSPRYRRHVATLTARVLLPTVPTITADVEVTP